MGAKLRAGDGTSSNASSLFVHFLRLEGGGRSIEREGFQAVASFYFSPSFSLHLLFMLFWFLHDFFLFIICFIYAIFLPGLPGGRPGRRG